MPKPRRSPRRPRPLRPEERARLTVPVRDNPPPAAQGEAPQPAPADPPEDERVRRMVEAAYT